MTNATAAVPTILPRAIAMMAMLQALVALAIFSVSVTAPVTGVTMQMVGLFQASLFGVGAILSLASGRLCERFGPIRVAQGCALAMAAGALLLAAASTRQISIVWLLCAAAIFGLGFGPETPASSAFLGPLTPPARRPFVFSIRQTGNQIGAMLGSLVLPGIALLAVPSAFGLVAAIALCVCLLLGTMRRHEAPRPVGGAAPARLLEGWRRIWANPGLSLLVIPVLAFSAMQACLNTFLALHAVQVWRLQPVEAGTLMAATQGAGLAGRLLWGAMASHFSTARIWLGWLGAGMSMFALLVSVATSSGGLGPLLILALGFGLTASGWNGVFLAEVARLSPGTEAMTTGALLMLSYAGLVVGPTIFPLFVSLERPGGGFLVLAGVGLIGTLALLVPRAIPEQRA